MHSVNVAAWEKYGLIAFQDRPCDENFKVKKSAHGFLFTTLGLNLPAIIMLLPEPKILQEIRLAVLHLAKYLYRDSGPGAIRTRVLVYESIMSYD